MTNIFKVGKLVKLNNIDSLFLTKLDPIEIGIIIYSKHYLIQIYIFKRKEIYHYDTIWHPKHNLKLELL
jgi:hypothetical protein